ncbi:MAG: hypothetical protein KBT45_05995, partial [Bacteroidales bacterium]|nr:hypothetical protein [Candidatus Colimorpha pelethequi]
MFEVFFISLRETEAKRKTQISKGRTSRGLVRFGDGEISHFLRHNNTNRIVQPTIFACYFFISLLLYYSPLYFAPLVMPNGTAIESHRLSSYIRKFSK